jgi:hypothetical protein
LTPRVASHRRGAGDVEDRAAGSPFDPAPPNLLARIERAKCVRLDNGAKGVGRQCLSWRSEGRAGIVDQYVDRTERGLGLRHHGRDRLRIADIAGNRSGRATQCGDLGDSIVQNFSPATAGHNGRAAGRQTGRDAAAQPATAPGDDGRRPTHQPLGERNILHIKLACWRRLSQGQRILPDVVIN